MKRYVLVTTGKRGVFFGVMDKDNGSSVELKEAQCCVYWSSSTRGFLGLAERGPQDGSKVTPPVPELKLYDVTSVSLCTDEAVKKWQAQPWS